MLDANGPVQLQMYPTLIGSVLLPAATDDADVLEPDEVVVLEVVAFGLLEEEQADATNPTATIMIPTALRREKTSLIVN